MKILLKIKYDGTDFCGYQVQKNQRTVQGVLNEASKALLGVDCDITGCSRTDSGVHALAFFATVVPKDGSTVNIPFENLPRAYNSVLADDISVAAAYVVNDSFHPRYDVLDKEYTYLIYNSKLKDPFYRNRALYYAREIDGEHLEKMNVAAAHLCGKHDFASFMAEGGSVADTVREIKYAKIQRQGDILEFKVCGNGFLYNMVRIIVGTLLDVAADKTQPCDIENLILSKNRALAGQTVAAHGLYLSNVTYPKGIID